MQRAKLTLELANSLPQMYGKAGEQLKLTRRTLPTAEDSDSQSFMPEYHQIKKLGFKINKKKICSGGWSTHENQVYLQFMVQNSQDFLTETSRRKAKVFYRLSKILKRRTPDQCRSHHQKLQLKYKEDLWAIIKEVERKVHTCALQEYMRKQQELERGGLEAMRAQLLAAQQQQQRFRTVAKASWFNLKSSGSSLKLFIDPQSIGQW